MKGILKKISIITIYLVCISTVAFGQYSELSPTSIYGFGDLQELGSIRQRTLGGSLSTSLEKNRYSDGNMASLGGVRFFHFQTALSIQPRTYNFTQFDNSKVNFKNTFLSIPYISVAMPIDTSHGVGLAVGLRPFSTVSYQSSALRTDRAGTRNIFQKSGGLSEIYLGSSVTPIKNLNIGLAASYLFGRELSKKTTHFEDTAIYFDITEELDRSRQGVIFRTGLTYNLDFDSSHLQFGATYQLGTKLNSSTFNKSYTNIQNSTSVIFIDSINVLSKYNNSLYAPSSFSAGLSFQTKNNLILSAEYGVTTFSTKYVGDEVNNVKNSFRTGLGIQYTPDTSGRRIFKRMSYRAGLKYATLPTTIRGNTINDYRISVGVGIPLPAYKLPYSKLSFIDVHFEYGVSQTVDPSIYSKQYFGVGVGVQVTEIEWFRKRRLE